MCSPLHPTQAKSLCSRICEWAAHWSWDLPPTLTVISRQEREIKIMKMNSREEHSMFLWRRPGRVPKHAPILTPIPWLEAAEPESNLSFIPYWWHMGSCSRNLIGRIPNLPQNKAHEYGHCKGPWVWHWSCRTTDGSSLTIYSRDHKCHLGQVFYLIYSLLFPSPPSCFIFYNNFNITLIQIWEPLYQSYCSKDENLATWKKAWESENLGIGLPYRCWQLWEYDSHIFPV